MIDSCGRGQSGRGHDVRRALIHFVNVFFCTSSLSPNHQQVSKQVKACSQHMNSTDLQQVDPVTRRVHWLLASAARLGELQQTKSVGAQTVPAL